MPAYRAAISAAAQMIPVAAQCTKIDTRRRHVPPGFHYSAPHGNYNADAREPLTSGRSIRLEVLVSWPSARHSSRPDGSPFLEYSGPACAAVSGTWQLRSCSSRDDALYASEQDSPLRSHPSRCGGCLCALSGLCCVVGWQRNGLDVSFRFLLVRRR